MDLHEVYVAKRIEDLEKENETLRACLKELSKLIPTKNTVNEDDCPFECESV